MKFPAGRETPGFWEAIEREEREQEKQRVSKPRTMKQSKPPKVNWGKKK